jgi:hypothetical protein
MDYPDLNEGYAICSGHCCRRLGCNSPYHFCGIYHSFINHGKYRSTCSNNSSSTDKVFSVKDADIGVSHHMISNIRAIY